MSQDKTNTNTLEVNLFLLMNNFRSRNSLPFAPFSLAVCFYCTMLRLPVTVKWAHVPATTTTTDNTTCAWLCSSRRGLLLLSRLTGCLLPDKRAACNKTLLQCPTCSFRSCARLVAPSPLPFALTPKSVFARARSSSLSLFLSQSAGCWLALKKLPTFGLAKVSPATFDTEP